MSQDRNPATLDIDRVPTRRVVEMIQAEDRAITGAVEKAAERIAHAVEQIAERISGGGRLFYAGAGTSGRIAFLDAAEIPPTFGVPPDLVSVILAGGNEAFTHAVEGAEDDESAAVRAVDERVGAADALIGIAASGTTPFTVAAVRRANMLGALTVGVTSRASTPLARECDIPIVIETGPEVIMGSTRMKSGTAQKLVLNTISTAVMVKLGRTYSNLMIDMPATNEKLRARAVAMVEIASGAPRPEAAEALEKAEGNVRLATVMAARAVDAPEGRELLEKAGGNLREVLGR